MGSYFDIEYRMNYSYEFVQLMSFFMMLLKLSLICLTSVLPHISTPIKFKNDHEKKIYDLYLLACIIQCQKDQSS